MSNCNQLIPDELLYMVVGHVHDRHTLYTLLTTNKAIFYAAVRRLWRDPFGFKFSTKEHFLQLYVYVLVISPCRHPDVEDLRQHVKPGPPPYRQPYVDYLALVHHISVQGIPKRVSLKDKTSSFLIPLLPFMVCNGRFEQLATIVTTPAKVRELIDAIPTMTQLSKVYWMLNSSEYTGELDGLTDIHRFVAKFVAEHGDRGRQLQTEFVSWNASEHADFLPLLAPQVEEMYRLLRPFLRSKTVLNNPYELLRYLAHKDDVDVSCIREIDLCLVNEGLDIALPWCFALEKLHVTDRIDCRPLFSLFSNAAQPDYDGSLKAPGPKAAPKPRTLVLQNVQLKIGAHDFSALTRGLAANCSTTMEEIELYLCASDDSDALDDEHVDVCVETMDWRFPRLRRLALRGDKPIHFVVRGDMSGMTRLKVLLLASTGFANDCNNIELFEPWNLPELRSLNVSGTTATQFRIESLVRSPKLKNLSLSPLPKNEATQWCSVIQPDWLDGVSLWSGIQLPLLEKILLQDWAASCIDLPTIVRCMPGLNELGIFIKDAQKENLADLTLKGFVFGKDGRPATGENELSGSLATPVHCHSNLKVLQLFGIISDNVKDYCSLVEADRFPQLTNLSIFTPVADKEFCRTLITAARRHPTLEDLLIMDSRVRYDSELDITRFGIQELLDNPGPNFVRIYLNFQAGWIARLK